MRTRFLNPFVAASRGYIDEVIKPRRHPLAHRPRPPHAQEQAGPANLEEARQHSVVGPRPSWPGLTRPPISPASAGERVMARRRSPMDGGLKDGHDGEGEWCRPSITSHLTVISLSPLSACCALPISRGGTTRCRANPAWLATGEVCAIEFEKLNQHRTIRNTRKSRVQFRNIIVRDFFWRGGGRRCGVIWPQLVLHSLRPPTRLVRCPSLSPSSVPRWKRRA